MAFFFRTLPYKGIFMILILWFRDRVRMKSSCTISQRHIFHPWTMDHVHHAQFFATLELSNQTNLRWRKNIKTLCLGTLGFNQIFASLILEAVISAGNLIWTWSLFGFFWVPIFPFQSSLFPFCFFFFSLLWGHFWMEGTLCITEGKVVFGNAEQSLVWWRKATAFNLSSSTTYIFASHRPWG